MMNRYTKARCLLDGLGALGSASAQQPILIKGTEALESTFVVQKDEPPAEGAV